MSKDALVIGINTYNYLNPLKSPSEDAEAVAQVLETYGEFTVRRLPAVKKDNAVRIGQKTEVTLAELENEIGKLFNPEGKSIPDTVLLYFSGHGLRKNRWGIQEGYLAASDTHKDKGNWGLSLKNLRELFQISPVRQQIIWLDCCYSGELFNFDEAYPGDKTKARDLCFIAASREFEAAYEEISGSHGILTGALLKGLNNHSEEEVSNLWLCDFISKTLKKEKAFQKAVFRNLGQPILLTRCYRPHETEHKIPVSVCPYKGLAYFDCNAEDPKYFFGRNTLTDQLIEKVRENSFLAVLGPSGSGKSSVVRAGLLHHLKLGQKLSGSGHWQIRIFRPGKNPLSGLATAFVDTASPDTFSNQLAEVQEAIEKGSDSLAQFFLTKAGNSRLVLLADQFEEVFTLCRDSAKRSQFFEILLGALQLTGNKICLILTMRSDFFGKCSEQEYAGLSARMQENLATVIPMTEMELRQAIEEPAKLAGLEVEPELVTQMIEDVKDSPGSLPLLQYALTELWKERKSDCLKLADYVRLGGVKGTLSKRADEIYESIGKEENGTEKQEIVKRIFTELTQLGEGTEDTRRRISKQSLITSQVSEEMVSKVIQKLADEKLIVTGEIITPNPPAPFPEGKGKGKLPSPSGEGPGVRSAVIDVAHEALIRHWALLKKWVDENREDIRFHRRLEEAALYWEKHNKAEGLLWRSPDLEVLQEFTVRKQGEMKAVETDFFKESVKAKEKAEAEKEAVRKRELEQAKALAEEQRKRAEEEVKASRKLEALLIKNYWFNAARAIESDDWVKSAHFSAQAGRIEPEHLQRKNYILNLQSHIKNCLMVYQIQHEAIIRGIKFSKNKNRFLTWSSDGTARLWDTYNGKPVTSPMKHDHHVYGAIFNRDETQILTWSDDGTARLWIAADGEFLIEMKHKNYVTGAAFNQDEKRILTWSGDGTVQVWDASDGKPLTEPMIHESGIRGVLFNNNKSKILTWGYHDYTRLWDTFNAKPKTEPMIHESPINGAFFSKDESMILTWCGRNARLWDSSEGKILTEPMTHQDNVNGAIFSKDETRILTWSIDGTARVWDSSDGKPITEQMKHENNVIGAVFNRNETRILTWSKDGTARLWNASDGSPLTEPMKHNKEVNGASFSRDEIKILTWSGDGTARLWDASNGKPMTEPMIHRSYVGCAIFSGDETRILTWSDDGTARIWNASDGSPLTESMIHEKSGIVFSGAFFCKDESMILTCSGDNTARMWYIPEAIPVIKPMKHQDKVRGAIFSRDETRILTWSYDGTARLWNASDGRPVIEPMKHDGHVNGAKFSNNESRILTWSDDGTVRLWNVFAEKPDEVIMKHEAGVHEAVFNKDYSRILSWSRDGTARLWDAYNGNALITPKKHEMNVEGAVFSKDESRILTWCSENTVCIWDASDAKLLANPIKLDKSVIGAAFSKDETRILTWCGPDDHGGAIQLWNSEDGSSIGQVMKHEKGVNCAVFSKNETRILTWSDDGTARLWNASDGKLEIEMNHKINVYEAVFSKDESRILTCSLDGTARLWNASDGELQIEMKHRHHSISAIFNKDESRILTWDGDGAAQLWDSSDGKPLTEPMMHKHFINKAIFSKDETRILTWSYDGTARLWNASDGKPLIEPMRHNGSLNGALFSKDETRILTWSDDGTARLWNIEADYDFPKEHLPLLVEVATGTAMDDFGNVKALNAEDWKKKRTEYIAIAEEHLKTCQYKTANLYLKQKQAWGK